MTLADLTHSLVLLGVCISMLGFVFGSILENKKVRTLLEDFWVALTEQVESPPLLQARTLDITANVFAALYQKNGKLSPVKLLTVTFVFGVTAAFAPKLGTANSIIRRDSIASDMVLVTVLWIMAAYVYEYGAYRISLYFLRRATQHNKKIYLGVNLAVLIFAMYGLPSLVLHYLSTHSYPKHSSLDLLILFAVGSPLFPAILLMQSSLNDLFNNLLLLPAALSFCFPVALLLGSLAVLRNRWTLNLLVKSIERITAVNARRIKLSSLALLSFVSSVSGIISYLMVK